MWVTLWLDLLRMKCSGIWKCLALKRSSTLSKVWRVFLIGFGLIGLDSESNLENKYLEFINVETTLMHEICKVSLGPFNMHRH